MSTPQEPTGRGDAPERPPMPRWVKVSGIVAIVLAVVVGILILFTPLGPGGGH